LPALTSHGTLLYLDAAAGESRYGPAATGPANAFFPVRGSRGRINYDAGGIVGSTFALLMRGIMAQTHHQ
jgi:hypothetical protein